MVFSAHARARPGVSQKKSRQLVPKMLHRAGQRTGDQRWFLLAPRRYPRGIPRNRAMVSEDHGICGSIAGRSEATGRHLARARHPDAAKLDWEVAGRDGEI